ncbi:MAG: indolepyruvate oxidoreductase subunit beta [Victivallales bacterium]|nr:indolepyruvate oxidoreductase subunit beta [Victivallales bacterium]
MKCDMVLAGVGGQGILTIAALVGKVAMAQGLNVKQSEVHGMAQRGGSVLAHLRLSDAVIHSDLIADGTADVVLGMEPMEALRHGPALGKDGVIIANANPVVNIGDYPELAQVHEAIKGFPHHVLVDGEALAKEAGSVRSVNMVLLGTLSSFLPLPEELFTQAIAEAFARKGEEIVAMNMKAFTAGRQAAKN